MLAWHQYGLCGFIWPWFGCTLPPFVKTSAAPETFNLAAALHWDTLSGLKRTIRSRIAALQLCLWASEESITAGNKST